MERFWRPALINSVLPVILVFCLATFVFFTGAAAAGTARLVQIVFSRMNRSGGEGCCGALRGGRSGGGMLCWQGHAVPRERSRHGRRRRLFRPAVQPSACLAPLAPGCAQLAPPCLSFVLPCAFPLRAEANELATRLEMIVALFLALTAVQFVLSDSLPTSSYVVPTQQASCLIFFNSARPGAGGPSLAGGRAAWARCVAVPRAGWPPAAGRAAVPARMQAASFHCNPEPSWLAWPCSRALPDASPTLPRRSRPPPLPLPRSWCWPPTSSSSWWPLSPSSCIISWSGTPRSRRRRWAVAALPGAACRRREAGRGGRAGRHLRQGLARVLPCERELRQAPSLPTLPWHPPSPSHPAPAPPQRRREAYRRYCKLRDQGKLEGGANPPLSAADTVHYEVPQCTPDSPTGNGTVAGPLRGSLDGAEAGAGQATPKGWAANGAVAGAPPEPFDVAANSPPPARRRGSLFDGLFNFRRANKVCSVQGGCPAGWCGQRRPALRGTACRQVQGAPCVPQPGSPRPAVRRGRAHRHAPPQRRCPRLLPLPRHRRRRARG